MPELYRFKFSVCQLLFISGAHALAVLVIAYTDLSAAWQFTLSFLVVFSWAIALLILFGRVGRRKIDALRYSQDKIICYAKSEIQLVGTLLPHSIVTPYFILLYLQDESTRSRCHVWICHDQLTKTEFRRLSVRLRLA